MKILSKKYRLVWNNKNQIVLNDEFSENSRTYTEQNCFESDKLEYIEGKIKELNLIILPEIEELCYIK